MSETRDRRILDYLEDTLDSADRNRFESELAASETLRRDVARVRAGLAWMRELAVEDLPPVAGAAAKGSSGSWRARVRRRAPLWQLALASAATLAVAVPATVWLSGADQPTVEGRPPAPSPSYALVLHDVWPDAASIDRAEQQRRAAEYWEWTSDLAERGILVAAGDLAWEPGRFLDAGTEAAIPGPVSPQEPGFVVGMFVVRVDGYEQAIEVARNCPHLRYGGSVSIREVGTGFVTVPGMGDAAG